MIKVFLKLCLLITFTAGLSSLCRAQVLAGEWVGNSEPSGRSEFLRFSLSESAGEIQKPLKAKLTLVQREGSRVRIELESLKLVMIGTITGDEIDGEAEAPGIKAHFHLVRTVKVAPEILDRYLGAYRFGDGDYLVVDRFPNTTDTLWVTDVKSGEARTIFPRSQTQFTGGPFLSVVSPTRKTLTFRDGGVHVIDLDVKGRQSGAFAKRSPISQEEVTFKNGNVTLSGTLLLPASVQKAARTKSEKHPALVFVHGGGAQFREMYWGLGYLYAARGFAVLAYDKRGVGKSTGNWRESSFEDLADDAVAGAKFLQSRTEIAPNQIGFWGQSQGGWIAPLAASRFPEAAFAVALSGGALSPAETELFDTEFELAKAGYTANEIKDALAWQKLKNEIIASPSSNEKWEEYAKLRLTAKDAKWFRQPGIDIFGPETRDHPFWTFMRRFYAYDPAPTLRTSKAPLLVIYGELDTPEGVKASVGVIRQIMDQAGRHDYTIKVYPNGSHNLMEVPPENPNEFVRLKRFPPGFFEMLVDWTTAQVRRRAPIKR